MTMILCTKRDSFTVLAAERRIVRSNQAVGSVIKIVRHPKMPLAFAAGGDMMFTLDYHHHDGVVSYLKQFADTVDDEKQLVVCDIADALRIRFQRAMNLAQDRIQIFIALVREGKADIGTQIICDEKSTTERTEFHPYYAVIPIHLSPYKDKDAYCCRIHDPTLSTPQEVAHRLRQLIQEAIAEQQQFTANARPGVIGGDVDVVVVNASGAKFV